MCAAGYVAIRSYRQHADPRHVSVVQRRGQDDHGRVVGKHPAIHIARPLSRNALEDGVDEGERARPQRHIDHQFVEIGAALEVMEEARLPFAIGFLQAVVKLQAGDGDLARQVAQRGVGAEFLDQIVAEFVERVQGCESP